MAAYDADGKLKLTASPGSGRVGLYAPDGSIYYTTSPGSGRVGSMAPDGSIYITDATGSAFSSVYAPDGSIRVTSANEYNGAWRVSGISSVVASWNASTSTLAMLTAIVNHTRTSLATMFDSTGKLTYAPNNLLTYSNTFSNAAWTKSSMSVTSGATDPFGTAFAWTLTATGPSALLYQLQSLAGPNAIPFVWMRRKTGSGIIYLRNANNVSIDVTAQVSSSWALVYVAPTAALGGNLFLIGLATSGDEIEVYSAGYSAVTYEATPRLQDRISTGASAYYGPRIDYDPNTLAVKGLLIEEARTNLNIQSGPLTTSWPVAGVTRTAGAATASDGTLLASKFTATTGTSIIQFYTTPVSVAAGNYTNSIEIDGSSGAFPVLVFLAGTSSASAVFDVTTNADGTATQFGTTGAGVTIISTKQTYLGGGRYRLWLSASLPASTVYCYYGMTPNKTGNTFAVGSGLVSATWAGTEYIIASMSQFEDGAFATSYIPTAASSVTRAADVVQFTGAALTALQGSAATFVGQTIGLSFNPAANSALAAATAGNAIIAYVTNSNAVGVAAAATYNGAAALTVGTPNYTTSMRIGSAFSGSGRSLVVNGGSVATDANAIGSRPAVYLGGTGASLYLNGWMQSFAIYNQRLPDAILQSKSIVGATY